MLKSLANFSLDLDEKSPFSPIGSKRMEHEKLALACRNARIDSFTKEGVKKISAAACVVNAVHKLYHTEALTIALAGGIIATDFFIISLLRRDIVKQKILTSSVRQKRQH